jgi:hypothetical protein
MSNNEQLRAIKLLPGRRTISALQIEAMRRLLGVKGTRAYVNVDKQLLLHLLGEIKDHRLNILQVQNHLRDDYEDIPF